MPRLIMHPSVSGVSILWAFRFSSGYQDYVIQSPEEKKKHASYVPYGLNSRLLTSAIDKSNELSETFQLDSISIN